MEALIKGSIELRAREDRVATDEELPLLRLANLAASIHQDGLTNPITVAGAGDNYVIETGERRWVAFHLLNDYFAGDDYSAIPARRVSEVNLWRQASENTARDNLNAIARARQIALLLMDMHGWDNFAPIHAFEREQDFYAQVADSVKWRVPYGRAEQLCAACGFENASRIRQFRALLRLSHEQWNTADDRDIAEFELRKWLHPRRAAAASKSRTGGKSSTLPGRPGAFRQACHQKAIWANGTEPARMGNRMDEDAARTHGPLANCRLSAFIPRTELDDDPGLSRVNEVARRKAKTAIRTSPACAAPACGLRPRVSKIRALQSRHSPPDLASRGTDRQPNTPLA